MSDLLQNDNGDISKCPFFAGTTKKTAGQGVKNRDWWPSGDCWSAHASAIHLVVTGDPLVTAGVPMPLQITLW